MANIPEIQVFWNFLSFAFSLTTRCLSFATHSCIWFAMMPNWLFEWCQVEVPFLQAFSINSFKLAPDLEIASSESSDEVIGLEEPAAAATVAATATSIACSTQSASGGDAHPNPAAMLTPSYACSSSSSQEHVQVVIKCLLSSLLSPELHDSMLLS